MLETGQVEEGNNWQAFAIGSAAQAVIGALGFGLLAPPVGIPAVILSNTTVTIVNPGAPAAAQTLTLGATALEVSGSSFPLLGTSSPVLLAAGSDRDNPCNVEEQQRNTAEQPRGQAPRAGVR